MRALPLVGLCLAFGLGACSVVGVAADAVSVTGTVVSTTVNATADVAGAAVHAVSGSGKSDDEKKSETATSTSP
jgi:hypothetical protein